MDITSCFVGECSICGDVADGYHYGVLSCRGCNAFFRRAVTHGMQFHCRRGGTCHVDKNARCACRACRLKKCEQMGMDRKGGQPSQPNQLVSIPRLISDVLSVSKNDNILPSPSREVSLISRLVDDYKEQVIVLDRLGNFGLNKCACF
ncbi:unnamed protein product [Gongylonema pulchrum]|uniref:Nuclear receptor domain-containing protein n=1 Tax=Gongylonema pulchrum TaxID=637853 RepID=A0A183EWC4_9BILA|nr:unnamed protein product [Gongylonema pulchrum]